MNFKRITESESNYHHLEKMMVEEILTNINREDKRVAIAVEEKINSIEKLVEDILPRIQKGGRIFYLGAGTSGRLGIVDASECPPTFGVPQGLFIGIIAGGDSAIRKAVEFAEDNPEQGWEDLNEHHLTENDTVIGIAASGTTPYVINALKECNKKKILTACITCNEGSPLAEVSKHPIEIVCGPEFLTGSTRMKAGTAQKLVLNMISTALMIKFGRVKGNRMIDMQLSNNKLIDRGVKMVMEATGLSENESLQLLKTHGSVREAIDHKP